RTSSSARSSRGLSCGRRGCTRTSRCGPTRRGRGGWRPWRRTSPKWPGAGSAGWCRLCYGPDGAGLTMKGDPRALLRACWSPLVTHAAQVYAAGPELADALRVCAAMSRRGVAGTIGYWNRQGEQPRQVADTYLAALDAVSREGTDCYLSIKAW